MKLLALLTVVLSSSFARPDVGLTGYQYQIPATRYGVPLQSTNSRQYYHVSDHVGPIVPSTAFQTPIHESTGFKGSSFSSNLDLGGGSLGNFPLSHDHFSDSRNHLVSSGLVSLNRKSNFGGDASDQVEVQKHLYFYTAPEEPEEVQRRVNIPAITRKKNVKILFIKAPSFHAPAPVQIPVQQQNEEKTLIYVLVKKPEEAGEIRIPEVVPTKPSKPEVYFIRYKTQKEAQDAIANVQESGGALNGASLNANAVENQNEFVNNLGNDDSNLQDSFKLNQRTNLVSNDYSGFVQPQRSSQTTISGTSTKTGPIFTHITEGPLNQQSTTLASSGIEDGSEGHSHETGTAQTIDNGVNINVKTSAGSTGLHETYGPPNFSSQHN